MSRVLPRKPEPFTYREYCLLPEDGRRHELIEGEFYVTPSPGSNHQTVSRRLQQILMEQLEDRDLAQVFNAPMDLLLDDTTCVQPDLFIVRASKAHQIQPHAVVGVPDLVVEILSPSHPGNDRFLKRGVYARFRIPEYWIVDPVNGFITVLRSSEPGKYDLEARFDRASVLTSEEFPELAVPLPRVFR
ncbi:MAG: Uma2 family endonuclease [Deltaproteobacteria bacterium]|nr:Uma2 family endonuclease [Deltaproteobacteria bacterium]